MTHPGFFAKRNEPDGHGRLKAPLLGDFAEEFGSGQPDELAAGRNEALEFHERDAGFFQRRDVVAGADGSGDDVVQVRGVTEDEDGGEILVPSEFAEKLNWFGATPISATPLATWRVFSTPSAVRKRSGSGGHLGSSRSTAMPWRTI